jgi:FkbM family methyltransferase
MKPLETLRNLADHCGFAALDVGARGGVGADLLPLAGSIDYFAFEPDPEECRALNSRKNEGPWKSLTYIPAALAETDRELSLNLYGKPGCSSAYRARKELGALYSRAEYYDHVKTIQVPAQALDQICVAYSIKNPAFMKIDVQGMEVDVFKGARDALANDLVGIRTEVSLFPMYESQPLFAEVDQALRPYGFVPMRWLELHEWRRSTRVKYPRVTSGAMPYSRGQMMHGDVLYLLHPEAMGDQTPEEISRMIRLALIAICYGHLDHAHAVLARPRVREFARDCIHSDPLEALESLSVSMARSTRWRRLLARLAMRFHRAPVNWT